VRHVQIKKFIINENLIEFYNGDLIMHAKYVDRDFEAHNRKRFTYHLL